MRRFIGFALAPAAFVVLATALGSVVRGDDPAPVAPPAPPVKPTGDALPPPPDTKPDAKPKDPSDPKADPKAGEAEKKPEPVKAPEFTLKDLDGKERTLAEFAGKWVVLEWTNYSCPFVKKHYGPKSMQATQKTYMDKGVVWLSICSSGEGKQGYMLADAWKKAVADAGAAPTAVLLDAEGTVGHLYGARTTPDMRIVDPKGVIVYTGAIDDDSGMKSDPTKAKNYVALVLDAVLAGKDAPISETKAYG